ncbi:serine/threonine-protein kinase [Streptomyces sp.]|uniref:serine/threonine-protein kinase n=1 Tax=Streptomyces sp. TaxID=1931 RepID=UPI002F41DAF1
MASSSGRPLRELGRQPSDAAPPIAPLEAGTRPTPGYEILAHLDRTGWLDVYDAWSEVRDCRCVVKMVRPDRRHEQRLRDRLLREGRWLQAFTHPHLVRGYETVETPEPIVVLETLTGETLSHLIHRLRRRPSAADLALLGLHLCSAMHYLHGQGLLHLDIKPSNVVIDCRHAKVLDLSIARPPGPAPPGLGTFCYLAPEQASGGPLAPAADVWGIGVTLYEAATGDALFDSGETAGPGETGETGETADRREGSARDASVPRESPARGEGGGDSAGPDGWYPQLEERAAPVGTRRRLPHGLAAAIDGCLEPDPAARPTVGELTAALDDSLPQHRRWVPPPSAAE